MVLQILNLIEQTGGLYFEHERILTVHKWKILAFFQSNNDAFKGNKYYAVVVDLEGVVGCSEKAKVYDLFDLSQCCAAQSVGQSPNTLTSHYVHIVLQVLN